MNKGDSVLWYTVWNELSCPDPNGSEDLGVICSRGGHTKESVLAVELLTTGLSACESALPSSWAQNPAVGQVWAEREAVFALSPSPQQAHKNIPQELEPPKCKCCVCKHF